MDSQRMQEYMDKPMTSEEADQELRSAFNMPEAAPVSAVEVVPVEVLHEEEEELFEKTVNKNEVPSYVREAEDKAIEAKAQRIFGPPGKRERDIGWEKREIADLDAYNELLDRREKEAQQAAIDEAREQWKKVDALRRVGRIAQKKTA